MGNFGRNVIGRKGELTYAKNLQENDTIIFLERQIDLGNSSPIKLTNVKHGKTSMIEYNLPAGLSMSKRLHPNTIVLRCV